MITSSVQKTSKAANGFVTWSPALADRDTALALAFPESFPALPPAYLKWKKSGLKLRFGRPNFAGRRPQQSQMQWRRQK